MKRSSYTHFAFLVMLLLALSVRGLIPVGFMPGQAHSRMALTICSGLDTKTIFVNDHQAPVSSSQDKHEPCPFAPPVLADNVGSSDFADYVVITYATSALRFLDDVNHQLIFSKYFFSQGPPAISVV